MLAELRVETVIMRRMRDSAETIDSFTITPEGTVLESLSPSEIEAYKAVRQDYRLKQGALMCLTGLGLAVLIGGVLSGGSYLLARKLET